MDIDYKLIEKSIIKKFRKKIWSRFVRAVDEYKMIKDGDKIAVCISGGKDSSLLAKCLEELKRHGNIKFDIEYLVMDPGYDKESLNKLKSNLEKLNIKATIFNSNIFEIAYRESNGEPCYLCARMRRGALYSKAQELGCNKIALGHHFDDVIETIMLNIIYAGIYKTMMPKLKSQNFANMELIRPLYYVKEEDIKAWVNYNNLEFIHCSCPYICSSEPGDGGKRSEMKKLIAELRKKYENIDINIMRSSENVELDAIIGYKKDGKKVSFLDKYDE